MPHLEVALALGILPCLEQNNVLPSRSFYYGQGKEIGVTGAMGKTESKQGKGVRSGGTHLLTPAWPEPEGKWWGSQMHAIV